MNLSILLKINNIFLKYAKNAFKITPDFLKLVYFSGRYRPGNVITTFNTVEIWTPTARQPLELESSNFYWGFIISRTIDYTNFKTIEKLSLFRVDDFMRNAPYIIEK